MGKIYFGSKLISDTDNTYITGSTIANIMQQSDIANGWFPAPDLTYSSVDGPTQVLTASGDITNKLYEGTKLKYNQVQALTSYWSFDTNNADAKGTATMSNAGTPTYTSGKFGNALTLNGVDQGLAITDAAVFKPTSEFTVAAWIKTSNTGANKCIFQSYNYLSSTNYGFTIFINTSNTLTWQIGNGSTYSLVYSKTNLCDGNWHYIVVTYRNNYGQIYVDGQIEYSGYMITPVYNATNCVRIGYQTFSTTNNNWFNGQIDDMFFMSGYALDENTIRAKYLAGAAQGSGDLILVKCGIVTKSLYSGSSTTISMYSGNDYTMTNAAISSAYYSQMKSPQGFQMNPDKWTIFMKLMGLHTGQDNPTGSVFYNIGSTYSDIAIGSWILSYSTHIYVARTAGGTMWTTLSTSSSAVSDYDFVVPYGTSIANSDNVVAFSYSKNIILTSKTRWYLLAWNNGGVSFMRIWNDTFVTPTIIKAVCAYL